MGNTDLWHLTGQIYCALSASNQSVDERVLLDEAVFCRTLNKADAGLGRAFKKSSKRSRSVIRALVGCSHPFDLNKVIEAEGLDTDLPLISNLGVSKFQLHQLCETYKPEELQNHIRYMYSRAGYAKALKEGKVTASEADALLWDLVETPVHVLEDKEAIEALEVLEEARRYSSGELSKAKSELEANQKEFLGLLRYGSVKDTFAVLRRDFRLDLERTIRDIQIRKDDVLSSVAQDQRDLDIRIQELTRQRDAMGTEVQDKIKAIEAEKVRSTEGVREKAKTTLQKLRAVGKLKPSLMALEWFFGFLGKNYAAIEDACKTAAVVELTKFVDSTIIWAEHFQGQSDRALQTIFSTYGMTKDKARKLQQDKKNFDFSEWEKGYDDFPGAIKSAEGPSLIRQVYRVSNTLPSIIRGSKAFGIFTTFDAQELKRSIADAQKSLLPTDLVIPAAAAVFRVKIDTDSFIESLDKTINKFAAWTHQHVLASYIKDHIADFLPVDKDLYWIVLLDVEVDQTTPKDSKITGVMTRSFVDFNPVKSPSLTADKGFNVGHLENRMVAARFASLKLTQPEAELFSASLPSPVDGFPKMKMAEGRELHQILPAILEARPTVKDLSDWLAKAKSSIRGAGRWIRDGILKLFKAQRIKSSPNVVQLEANFVVERKLRDKKGHEYKKQVYSFYLGPQEKPPSLEALTLVPGEEEEIEIGWRMEIVLNDKEKDIWGIRRLVFTSPRRTGVQAKQLVKYYQVNDTELLTLDGKAAQEMMGDMEKEYPLLYSEEALAKLESLNQNHPGWLLDQVLNEEEEEEGDTDMTPATEEDDDTTPDKPTEMVPPTNKKVTGEEGGTGDIQLPDGTAIGKDQVRQIVAKALGDLSTQVAQGTEPKAEEPEEGDEEEPEEPAAPTEPEKPEEEKPEEEKPEEPEKKPEEEEEEEDETVVPEEEDEEEKKKKNESIAIIERKMPASYAKKKFKTKKEEAQWLYDWADRAVSGSTDSDQLGRRLSNAMSITKHNMKVTKKPKEQAEEYYYGQAVNKIKRVIGKMDTLMRRKSESLDTEDESYLYEVTDYRKAKKELRKKMTLDREDLDTWRQRMELDISAKKRREIAVNQDPVAVAKVEKRYEKEFKRVNQKMDRKWDQLENTYKKNLRRLRQTHGIHVVEAHQKILAASKLKRFMGLRKSIHLFECELPFADIKLSESATGTLQLIAQRLPVRKSNLLCTIKTVTRAPLHPFVETLVDNTLVIRHLAFSNLREALGEAMRMPASFAYHPSDIGFAVAQLNNISPAGTYLLEAEEEGEAEMMAEIEPEPDEIAEPAPEPAVSADDEDDEEGAAGGMVFVPDGEPDVQEDIDEIPEGPPVTIAPEPGPAATDTMMGTNAVLAAEKIVAAGDEELDPIATEPEVEIVKQELISDEEATRALVSGEEEIAIDRARELVPGASDDAIGQAVIDVQTANVEPHPAPEKVASVVVPKEEIIPDVVVPDDSEMEMEYEPEMAPVPVPEPEPSITIPMAPPIPAVEVNSGVPEEEEDEAYEGYLASKRGGVCEVVTPNGVKKFSANRVRLLPKRSDLNSCLLEMRRGGPMKAIARRRLYSRAGAVPMTSIPSTAINEKSDYLLVYLTRENDPNMFSLLETYGAYASDNVAVFPLHRLSSREKKQLVAICEHYQGFMVGTRTAIRKNPTAFLFEELEVPQGDEANEVALVFEDGMALLQAARKALVDFEGLSGKIISLMQMNADGSGKKTAKSLEKLSEEISDVYNEMKEVMAQYSEAHDVFKKEFPDASAAEAKAKEEEQAPAPPVEPVVEPETPVEPEKKVEPEEPVEPEKAAEPPTEEPAEPEKEEKKTESIAGDILRKYDIKTLIESHNLAKLGRIVLTEQRGLTTREVDEVIDIIIKSTK